MLGLVVCGAAGRMGSTVVRLIQESAGVRLVGAVEWSGSPQIDKDAGEVAGVGKVGVPITPQLAPLLQNPVVVIDFTTPEATLEHLKIAARKGAPIVIGTTGFNPKQLSEIKRLSRRDRSSRHLNGGMGRRPRRSVWSTRTSCRNIPRSAGSRACCRRSDTSSPTI